MEDWRKKGRQPVWVHQVQVSVCFPFCNAPSDEIRQNKMYEKRVGNKHAMQRMAPTGQFASICQYLRMSAPYFSCLQSSASTAASFLLLSYCLATCAIDYKVDYYWTICKLNSRPPTTISRDAQFT